MKEFKDLWKQAAVIALGVGVIFLLAALATASPILWGLAVGIVPGEIDLIGLGLRLPLWARLNPRAAVTGVNLRLLSRLVILGVYFYVLRRYTQVSIYSALAGVFIPHAVYLIWAAIHGRSKGVSE